MRKAAATPLESHQQVRPIAIMLGYLDFLRQHPAQQPCDLAADRIVAALGIADTEHDPADAIAPHGCPRSMSSRKKCAEQEMQGS
jgi:hypothetical protein